MLRSLIKENDAYFVIFLLFWIFTTSILILFHIPFPSLIANCVFDMLIGFPIGASLTVLVGYKKLGEIWERENKKAEGEEK